MRASFPSVSVAVQRCVSSVTDRRTAARGTTAPRRLGAGWDDTAARRDGPTVGLRREHPFAGREDRPKKHTTPILLAVLASVALAGCASAAPVSTAPAGTGGELPTAAATAAGSTSGAPTAATPSSTPTAAFPVGEPPRPGAQDQYPKSDTVPGLTAAIAAAQHPGLQICDGFESLIIQRPRQPEPFQIGKRAQIL